MQITNKCSIAASLLLLLSGVAYQALAGDGQLSRWEDSKVLDYPPPPVGGWEPLVPTYEPADNDDAEAEAAKNNGQDSNHGDQAADPAPIPKTPPAGAAYAMPPANPSYAAPVAPAYGQTWPPAAAPGYYRGYARPGYNRPGFPVPGFGGQGFNRGFNAPGVDSLPGNHGNPWNNGNPGGWGATPWGDRGPTGWIYPNQNTAPNAQKAAPYAPNAQKAAPYAPNAQKAAPYAPNGVQYAPYPAPNAQYPGSMTGGFNTPPVNQARPAGLIYPNQNTAPNAQNAAPYAPNGAQSAPQPAPNAQYPGTMSGGFNTPPVNQARPAGWIYPNQNTAPNAQNAAPYAPNGVQYAPYPAPNAQYPGTMSGGFNTPPVSQTQPAGTDDPPENSGTTAFPPPGFDWNVRD